jgi:hypothetical protein
MRRFGGFRLALDFAFEWLAADFAIAAGMYEN